MTENLDDILNNEPTAEADKVEEAAELHEPSDKVDPPSDRLRDEHGRFAKKEEPQPEAASTTEAPQAAPQDQLPAHEFAALKDERRKRQALEEELARLRNTPPPQPQAPPIGFWDDPDSALDTRLNQFGEALLQRIEQREQAKRFDQSETAAKAKYTDYPEAFVAFEQAVRANPSLAQEMVRAPDPGEYAYAKGKAALTLEQVGSIDELEKTLRAKWEAETLAKIAPQTTLPSTTAADGTVGSRSGPDWSGPPSLKELLG